MCGKVLSVNVGVAQANPANGQRMTGTFKRPTDSAVLVRPPGSRRDGLGSGLVGDDVCNRRHHGGDDQAVYAYAREDYDWWESELGRRLAPGQFGENLTTAGVDASGAVIGEIWRIGDELVLQVAGPRIPCATFQAAMGLSGWVKRFTREARSGTYLRVIEPGHVRAGDSIVVADRPDAGLTVDVAFRALTTEPALLTELHAAEHVTGALRNEVDQLLARRA